MPLDPTILGTELVHFIITVLIATALGALLGTQREMLQQRWNVQEFGGIRSFMMLSLSGLLSALLARSLGAWFVGVTCSGVILFLSIGYVRKSFRSEHAGVTSELAGLLTYLIGVLTYYDSTLAVAVGVLVALIITLKDPLHDFVSKISQQEFLSTVEFVLLSCVILPLLPNRAIDQWGIFNPYEFWVFVIVVLAVSFAGYVATKLFGNRKGLILTGILGGTVSSTAVTSAMSAHSRKSPKLVPILASATIAASAVMFLRVGVVLSFLSLTLLRHVQWPLLAMFSVTLIGLAFPLYQAWRRGDDGEAEEVTSHSPFSLSQGLKFGLFVLTVLVLSFVLRLQFGVSGIYLTAIITGLVDVDAFMLSMVHLSSQEPALAPAAANAVLIAIGSNMLVKSAIPFLFGSRGLAWRVASVFVVSVATGVTLSFLA